MKEKHILFLTPGFPSDEANTQCIPALQVFVKELALQKGLKVSVISLHYPQQYGQRQWNGLDVYDAYSTSRLRIFFNVWKWIKTIHEQQEIDIIHSFWLTDAAFIGHWVGRFKNITHCITLMGQDVRRSNHYLRLFPLRHLNLIALSPFHADVYHQTTGLFIQNIIPWGLPQEDINVQTTKSTIDILGVGNLIPLKAYDQFIRVVKIVSEQHKKPLRAAIIGKGVEEKQLKQLTKDLGLEKIIHFYGNIDRQEVLGLMRQSTILLHPSTYESFGLVFSEALANGAYVVSKKVGIAQAAESWLLAETDEEMASQCLLSLASERRPDIVNHHLVDETVKQYLAYYQSL